MRFLNPMVFVLALVPCLSSSTGNAAVPPLSPSFQVNTYTIEDQQFAQVVTASDETFIVVWQSDVLPNLPGPDRHVVGRWFNPNGSPHGDEVVIRSRENAPRAPTIDVSSSDEVAIAWQESFVEKGDPDLQNDAVLVQLYDTDGVALDSPRQVVLESHFGDRFLGSPSALWSDADTGDADVLNVFYSSGVLQGPQFLELILGRRFLPGDDVGTEIQVSNLDTVTNSIRGARKAGGDFVVAWHQAYANSFNSYSRVRTRQFDVNGAGDPFVEHIPLTISPFSLSTDIALAEDGTGLLAWNDDPTSMSGEVRGQILDQDGTPSKTFVISESTNGAKGSVGVEYDGQDFVVVWQSGASAGSDVSGTSIQARRVSRLGTPMASTFQVNDVTLGNQFAPSIAAVANDAGRFTVVWVSETSTGSDADGRSIQARQFGFTFRDGFETGDLRFWSQQVGPPSE